MFFWRIHLSICYNAFLNIVSLIHKFLTKHILRVDNKNFNCAYFFLRELFLYISIYKNIARNLNIPKFCKIKQFEAAFCHVKILRFSTKKFHLFLFLFFTRPFICIFFLLNLSSRFIKHPNSLFVWWSTPQISISTNIKRYIILANATNDVIGQMLLKKICFHLLKLIFVKDSFLCHLY